MASQGAPINPEDRLFHLILALMSTSQGLTKDHILTTVRGYREDTESGMARESIERRFERDKDALRELGIPLEAVIPPEDDGNNKNTLYRIPKGDYDLPADITFSGRDIALLNVAAAIWKEGSLSREAHVATMKLASFGILVDETLVGFAPVISTRDPALSDLREAIDAGYPVSFDYLKPGEAAPSTRVVSPWALVNHEGRWHLYGLEDASPHAKTFLLRRIVSRVRRHQAPLQPSPDGVAALALAELEEEFQRNEALLEVTEGSDAAAALLARRGAAREGAHLRVHYTDPAIFADELCAYGSEVVVIEPEGLRRRVIENLRVLAAHHA